MVKNYTLTGTPFDYKTDDSNFVDEDFEEEI